MIKVNYDEKTGKVISFGKDVVPYIEITEEERKQPLPNKYAYYAVVDGKFTILERVPTKEEANKDNEMKIRKRLVEIQKWFRDNDWKVNKYAIGEWSPVDERWVEYLRTREAIRAEQDMLNALLQ
jgi:hypothetical protein